MSTQVKNRKPKVTNETQTDRAQDNNHDPVNDTPKVILIDPTEIQIDDEINVRPFSQKFGDPVEHDSYISELADSMRTQGQLQAIRVQWVNGIYRLISGRNRIEAAMVINTGLSAQDPPFLVKAEVVSAQTPIDAFLQAWFENQDRRDPSPMDRAYVIRAIRVNVYDEAVGTGEYKPNPKHTGEIARMLHLSEASVIQAERLLRLDEVLQKKIHDGVLTPAAAYEAMAVEPEQRVEVVEEAERRQRAKERAGARNCSVAMGEGAGVGGGEGSSSVTTKPKRGTRTRKQKAVKASEVRQVAREKGADKPKPRSVKEIREWADAWNGPGVGATGSPQQKFIEALYKFIQGEIANTTLDKYWLGVLEFMPDEEKEAKSKVKSKDKSVSKPVSKSKTSRPGKIAPDQVVR